MTARPSRGTCARTRPWLLNAVPSRTSLAPEGLGGGAPGVAGKFLVNGKSVSEARKLVMQPDDQVTLRHRAAAGTARHLLGLRPRGA